MTKSCLIRSMLVYLVYNIGFGFAVIFLLCSVSGATMAVADGVTSGDQLKHQILVELVRSLIFLQPVILLLCWFSIKKCLKKNKATEPNTKSQQLHPLQQDGLKNPFTSYAVILLVLAGCVLYYAVYFMLSPNIGKRHSSSPPWHQILIIVQNIRSLHATETNVIKDLNEIDLAKEGAFPRDMIDNPENPRNIVSWWGDPVIIRPATEPANKEEFLISYINVPKETCVSLFNKLTGSGKDPGLLRVLVGAHSVVTNFPITPEQARSFCEKEPQDMGFQFKLKYEQ